MPFPQTAFNPLISDHTFANFYVDDYDECYSGYALAISDNFLLIETFDEEGRPNGPVIIFHETVTRIQWGSSEDLETERLIDCSSNNIELTTIDLSSTESVLKSVQAHFEYVCFEVQEIDDQICFIGQIESIIDGVLKFKRFGTRTTPGQSQGLYLIEDITKIYAGQTYTENIYKMNRNHEAQNA